MNDLSKFSYDGIALAEKSATQVLSTVIEKLSSHTGSSPVFFPNGVELISIVVKVGAATGVDFELTVAGEKAPKSTQLTS